MLNIGKKSTALIVLGIDLFSKTSSLVTSYIFFLT